MKLKYRFWFWFFSYIIKRFRFWQREARKMADGGYAPPPPGLLARVIFHLLARIATFLVVGPVKVVGRENANFDGRLLIVANHCFNMDPAVLRIAQPYHFRTIGKRTDRIDYRSVFAAWIGVILVNVAGGRNMSSRGEETVQAASGHLASNRDSRLVVFPQGKRVLDNVLREEDFRTGAARILSKAARQLAYREPIALLPVGIVFDCEPKETSVFDANSGSEHIIPVKRFRTWKVVRKEKDGREPVARMRYYGATVAIGAPIPYSDLPGDTRACTRFIQERIQEQMDFAEGKSFTKERTI